MYLIFEKEQWEAFKANMIENATEHQKVFVADFFAMAEERGEWREFPE